MKLIIVLCFLLQYVKGETNRTQIMSHPNWKYFAKTECGIASNVMKITKGEFAAITAFPWLGQLLQRNDQKEDIYACVVALILPDVVITAAHCVYGLEKVTKYVRFGTNMIIDKKLKCPHCKPQTKRIDEIVIHENYDPNTFDNDLAIIRLEKPVKFQVNIRPICLPEEDLLENPFLAEKVKIAGWGYDSREQLSDNLKYVNLPMRDKCVCNSIYDKTLSEGQFCIGVDNGKDTCQGDSGSPVVWQDSDHFLKKHYIIGITSFGNEDCGEAPAIYTNVIAYMMWILDNLYDGQRVSLESNESVHS